VRAARRLQKPGDPLARPASLRDGLLAVVRSGLLLRLCGYVLLLTGTASLLYVEQARIVAQASGDAVRRTLLFARIDLCVNFAVLAAQLLLARRVLQARARSTLALLPAITAAGFAALLVWPTLPVIAAVQGLRKAAHFGLERPAREVICIALRPGEKYTSKSFIDTAVYRGGDALAAWLSQAMVPAALVPTALALCALWLLNSLSLARRAAAPAGGAR
jgi:AAA family ATP:ADP antiporter